MTPDWRAEFGDHYDVPHDVTARLWDRSYHHEPCPSFTHTDVPLVEGGRDLRLWVEHPDPAKRETPYTSRYYVVDGETVVVETDDLMEALDGFDAYVERTRPPMEQG